MRTVALLLVTLMPALSYGMDYNGQWLGTVTSSVNYCKNLGKAEPGDYKLTIIHKGADITIMENVVQRPYKGVVDPNKPDQVSVQGGYSDDGGYVSEFVELRFSGESAASGESAWQWSDGWYNCGGHFAFDLKRIRKE